MTPDRFDPDETELAVEELVVRKNGKTKSANDVFEVVVAMHHDSKKRDALILSKLDAHCRDFVHFRPAELEDYVRPFREMHTAKQEDIEELENELKDVKENCTKLHARAPRRKDDPETEEWGTGVYGKDVGDMTRAWRVLKYVVIVIGGAFLVAVGNELSTALFGG